AFILGIEDAQRVAFKPVEAVGGQLLLVAAEVVDQHPAVGGPALRVTQRVDLQPAVPGDAERLEDVAAERDHLHVGLRLGYAKDLRVDLMELTQAALLWPLV